MEEVQLAAQLAVVALLGLLQQGQVLLQVFFVGPGRAVNALQHFVAVVTAPIRPRHFHELEVLEFAGARHVGAAAQIFKTAFAVQADVFTSWDGRDDLGLVVLAHALEVGHGFIARQDAAHHGLVFGGQVGHFLFNRGQIVWGERSLIREVVIKAVVDHRADGHLRIGEQLFDGVGQEMGCGVANQVQTIGVLGGDDGQTAVLGDGVAGVDQAVVNLAAQSGLGQTGTNRSGDIGHRDRAGKLALRTVGKRDVDHGIS